MWGRYHFNETDRELLAYDEDVLATIDELDVQMYEQLAEDPDALVDYDTSAFFDRELTDPDVRDSARAALEARIAEARAVADRPKTSALLIVPATPRGGSPRSTSTISPTSRWSTTPRPGASSCRPH